MYKDAPHMYTRKKQDGDLTEGKKKRLPCLLRLAEQQQKKFKKRILCKTLREKPTMDREQGTEHTNRTGAQQLVVH